MPFVEALENELTDDQLSEIVEETLRDFKEIKRVLLIHPDYTRIDFTDRVVPLIYQDLKNKGMKEIYSLNASGTHRKMSEEEIRSKLGISSQVEFTKHYNHEYDDPNWLVTIGEISASFVAEKTNGELSDPIPITINKLLIQDFDLIVALSGTLPHEASGYAGGLKVFIPGVSGPEVIDLFHWAAVLIGIPKIIGTIENPARDVINEGSRYIFQIMKAPVVSFNMVFEEKVKGVVPKGLYTGVGFDGFIDAYKRAAKASSQIHVIYIDQPLEYAVQVIDRSYDEVWTAGKGSYKLQRPGVMKNGGEIIIYAPHIRCFHSKADMDAAIRRIGYHSMGYVKEFLRRHTNFSRNIAAHVVNVRGYGRYDPSTGEEEFPFKVTLASGISEDTCREVGLGYRDPNSIREEDFTGPGRLWIRKGGKYLYDRTSHTS